MIRYLNDVATELCDFYDRTCCSKQKDKHFSFQCKNNIDPTIASHLNGGFVKYGLEQSNQYSTFLGAYDIFSFISEKPETCAKAGKIRKTSSYLFNYCLKKFSGNFYITQFVKKTLAAQGINFLQEEDDKEISLGMPMHPQKEEW